MKNICIITGSDKNYSEIAKITIPNFLEYCNIHSIDLHISTKNLNSNIHWGWNKYFIIKQIINKYEWIVWIDIDCLFINTKKDIRQLIDDNYSLIIGNNYVIPNWYTEDNSYIENGVFLLKNDEISNKMLDRFLSDNISYTHPWVDQYKMIVELKNNIEFVDKVKKIDMIDINATEQFNYKKEEIFIYHCAGGENYNVVERIKLLKSKL